MNYAEFLKTMDALRSLYRAEAPSLVIALRRADADGLLTSEEQFSVYSHFVQDKTMVW